MWITSTRKRMDDMTRMKGYVPDHEWSDAAVTNGHVDGFHRSCCYESKKRGVSERESDMCKRRDKQRNIIRLGSDQYLSGFGMGRIDIPAVNKKSWRSQKTGRKMLWPLSQFWSKKFMTPSKIWSKKLIKPYPIRPTPMNIGHSLLSHSGVGISFRDSKSFYLG